MLGHFPWELQYCSPGHRSPITFHVSASEEAVERTTPAHLVAETSDILRFLFAFTLIVIIQDACIFFTILWAAHIPCVRCWQLALQGERFLNTAASHLSEQCTVSKI